MRHALIVVDVQYDFSKEQPKCVEKEGTEPCVNWPFSIT